MFLDELVFFLMKALCSRYFFKMRSNDIELGGVVQQEITDDDDILPMFDGKIIGKIEKQ